MATDAVSQDTWRFIFGDNREWMPPHLEYPPTAAEDGETRTAWRVIFGNTSAWLAPQLDIPAPLPGNAHRCELCRQPIADGESFVTNSAGQRPAHLRCSSMPSCAAREGKPPRSENWLSALGRLLRHQPIG